MVPAFWFNRLFNPLSYLSIKKMTARSMLGHFRHFARAVLEPAISVPKPRFRSLLPAYETKAKDSMHLDDDYRDTLFAKCPNAPNFLKLCTDHGLSERYMARAIETLPEITNFEPRIISKNIQQLYDLGFESVGIAIMIQKYPRLLDYGETDVTETFEAWRAGQLNERFIQRLFIKYPWLFAVSNDEVTIRLKRLFYLMQHKINRVTSVLLTSPTIMLGNWDEVEDKFTYCLKEMRYLEKDISRSTALAQSISYIKIRHLFLERVGVYVRPALKDESGMNPHKNPPLSDVVDPDDDQFAMNTAKVSPEEFRVFLKLMQYEEDDRSDLDDVKRDSEFDVED